ncbi:MAG: F0F1 ATP synthase subunit epsilon [Bacteroidetes bacterium]|jgi:F-type H+-transporting ATPase subunit epsilon|nr:F0F1 ATP synthase subunit epsilon [Bacteroidota bacterium]MDF1867051.1 F0F1 ATP synthase subunit epsilon [Saprospiraceae bacterium]
MNITVLTPDKEVFKGKITSVKVPGTLGQFQILKNHAPIVSSLQEGEIKIVASEGVHQYYDSESGTIQEADEPGKSYSFTITRGFIEVLNNEVSLLVQGVGK